jgi:dTDP-4-dehydrorhamnose reductase
MTCEVFIIGADGLIGSSLARLAAKNKIAWVGTSRNPKSPHENIIPLDLLDADEIHRLAVHPRITYLCAAQTDICKCEDDPAGTRLLNVTRTLELARHLHAAGSEIVFLSSNLVFDGAEKGPTLSTPYSPITEYGRQKAETEKSLLESVPRAAVVRLTKVVHPRFSIFQKWLRDLKNGQPIHPFSDMVFSPIDLDGVVQELEFQRHAFSPGIFQLTGDRDVSYAWAADLLAKCLRFDPGLVQPKNTQQAGYLRYFPRNTVMAQQAPTGRPEAPAVSTTLERIFSTLEA